MPSLRQLADRLRSAALRQVEREAFRSVLHVLLLLALVVVLRPMFAAMLPAAAYEAPSITLGLIDQDIDILSRAAQRHRPAIPHVLFLVAPTLLFVFAKRHLRWTDWQHGRSLRAFIMALVFMMAWSGSTFEYNMYLDRGHALDRLLLVFFAVLSWRTPLAVPFATRWAIILIKEAYVPIAQDDFDFRSIAEVLIVFSAFVWASAIRSFKPKHFLLVAMGAWASYYYCAGVAKWGYGPEHSWLMVNHLSNLSVGGYVRGWVNFIPESTFLALNDFVRQFDRLMAGFTLVLELGALVAFFIHPKLTRLWFALCFVFHLGIFVLTGICFWKWMFANAAFYVWLGRGGAPILKDLCKHKLVLALGILSVYYSANRIWYFPQTGVTWYDSRLVENYEIYAVGATGEKYLVEPNWLAPMDMHWVQGRMCYATNERSVTGIYGVTGSYAVLTRLETFETPEQGLNLIHRGRSCRNPDRQKVFDDFMRRFFGNVNRRGRPHDWVTWIGRPTHLWVHPQGRLYDLQEPVQRIELWRTIVYHHGGKLHRSEKKLVHQVAIPR